MPVAAVSRQSPAVLPHSAQPAAPTLFLVLDTGEAIPASIPESYPPAGYPRTLPYRLHSWTIAGHRSIWHHPLRHVPIPYNSENPYPAHSLQWHLPWNQRPGRTLPARLLEPPHCHRTPTPYPNPASSPPIERFESGSRFLLHCHPEQYRHILPYPRKSTSPVANTALTSALTAVRSPAWTNNRQSPPLSIPLWLH